MKQLYTMILESESIGSIGVTLDEFMGFATDDLDAYRTIHKKFDDKFGDKAGKMKNIFDSYLKSIILQMSNMKVTIDENILRYIYEYISKTPLTKVEKIIGDGGEACVFDLGDKVIKCYYNNTIPTKYRKFIEVCQSGKHKMTPKIYRVGRGYVVMEKLKMRTTKIDQLFKLLFKDYMFNGETKTLYHHCQDKTYDEKEMKKTEIEIVKFMREVNEIIRQCENENDYTDYGDFHKDNIGQRDNGELVYFDI